MTTTVAATPELIFQTLLAHQQSAALRTAIELDVFTAIAAGATTAPAIAKACNASERGIRMVCDFLTVIGFLEKTGGAYRLTPTSAMFLDRKSPAYLGSIADFLTTPDLTKNFAHLTATVRRGTIEADQNTVSEENPIWENFARAMVPMMYPAAQEIADILAVASAGPIRVLDIAAGHGMFGIAIAQQSPQAEIVAVDWPGVLRVASEHAAKMGVAARHRKIEGDAFKVDYGRGYHLALVTNFLHHFDVAACTGLLKKVAAALEPGGRVAVLEFVPNEDRVSPPMPAMFVMNMLAGTAAGDAFTLSELRGMLEAAGFGGITARQLHGPEKLIVGTR